MRRLVTFGAAAGLAILVACEQGTEPTRVATLTMRPSTSLVIEALQDTLPLFAEARDEEGRVIESAQAVWESLATEVATVDEQGRVVARGPGQARITASLESKSDTVTVTVPSGLDPAALRFVAFSQNGPALTTYDTTFWAVKGEERELEIDTVTGSGNDDGEFLEFEVPGDALLRYPDGTLFQQNDSVQIRLRIDTERFIFEFEPSGLQFDPEHPASLEIEYSDADEDDLEREEEFGVWKRETPLSPWLRIATFQLEDADEIEAEITSFTAFSLATR